MELEDFSSDAPDITAETVDTYSINGFMSKVMPELKYAAKAPLERKAYQDAYVSAIMEEIDGVEGATFVAGVKESLGSVWCWIVLFFGLSSAYKIAASEE